MIVTSDHGEFTGEDGRWGHNTFEKTIINGTMLTREDRYKVID